MKTATTIALKKAWEALYNVEMVQQMKHQEYRLTPNDLKTIEVFENIIWEMLEKYDDEHEA